MRDPTSLSTVVEGCWLFPWVPLSVTESIQNSDKRREFLSPPLKLFLSLLLFFPGLGVVQDDLSLLKLGSFYFQPDLALSHAELL